MIEIDYSTLEAELESGTFRQRLEDELTDGFRVIHAGGERLPPASYYASQIAEIVNRGADAPLGDELAFYVYQEVLLAVERARAAVLGEEPQ